MGNKDGDGMRGMGASSGGGGMLARLGLRTRQQRAWAMYDWANSAIMTVVITAVFPIFYSQYAASGLPASTATFRFSIATTIGLAIVAIIAPILGVVADARMAKKKLLGSFLGLGIAAIASMFFIQQGQWLFAAVLFVMANVGVNGCFVFYDSLLPHIAGRDEIDRVSTAGYALGYIGGGLVLVLSLVLIQNPGWLGIPSDGTATPEEGSLPARVSFVIVAVWWLVFSVPLFRRVREPSVRAASEIGGRALPTAFSRLRSTIKDLRKYRNAFLMLLAFLIYNDGIGTIIRMATIFGEEIGIERGALIASIVMVQFVAIPFAFAFGALAGLIGAKLSIALGLLVYTGISIFGFFLTTATQFFILALMVATVQGGTQALSRSLFGSMIPRSKSGEFFGLFAVFEKFAGVFGPAVFALVIALTHSSRNGVFALIVFFVAGAALLMKVDVEEGQRVAKEVDGES